MTDRTLGILGLAKKGNRLQAGDEPAGAAARSRDACLLLVAADAAENTGRRAQHYARYGDIPVAVLPYSKTELGAVLGRSSCAIAALTDPGLAFSFISALEGSNPGTYTRQYAALEEIDAKKRRLDKERAAHARKRKA